MKLLLGVAWSEEASPGIITGALLSLVSLISENPANMVRRLNNDPDLAITVIEFTISTDGSPRFASRGMSYQEQMDLYMRLRDSPPQEAPSNQPFEDDMAWEQEDMHMDEFMSANMTVQVQLWVLLIKAVTAPDTARDGENKRWIKFLQQKRVNVFYRLTPTWMDIVRGHIAEDLSIRRYMIRTLIEIQRMGQNKGRILEALADIGNYIEESGLAGFVLTIRFGIETRYAALALNEFQGDIATIERLMRLYLEMGPTAPFMVILEDSIQTKFAPGNYPLLWSYAMGVGSALDKAMANLNFNRSYLDYGYYRLGYRIVRHSQGSVDSRMAAELGVSEEEKERLRRLIEDMGTRGGDELENLQGGNFQLADPADFQNPDEDIDTGIRGVRGHRTGGSDNQTRDNARRIRGESESENAFAAAVEAAFRRDIPRSAEREQGAQDDDDRETQDTSDPTAYVGGFFQNAQEQSGRFNDAALLDDGDI
nr:MAG: nucleocapsid protein [Jingmen rodent narmovirus 1]WPV62662.1 MAG: nucleocapsid protein [Jingmen rodent narmovirus 1]